MTCVTREAARYCACGAVFDANAAPKEWLAVDLGVAWSEMHRRIHEQTCLAARDARIADALKFFARLDAERAMRSW